SAGVMSPWMHDHFARRVKLFGHLLDQLGHLMGVAGEHRLAEESIEKVSGDSQDDNDKNGGFYSDGLILNKVDYAVGKQIAQEPQEGNTRHRVNGICDNEANQGEA